jgi:hypothetical protein
MARAHWHERESRRPPDAPRALPVPVAPILALQRTAGNAAVTSYLQRSRDRSSQRLHRMGLYPFPTSSGTTTEKNAMATVGAMVKGAVESAVKTIAADPGFKSLDTSKSGYLARWAATWAKYVDKPSELPPFFFARYGYAVETLAVNLLAAADISPYSFHFQVSHGHTRPDIVVRNGSEEIAWIDITSEGSPSHIYDKQGAGWKTRPYVAEVRYDAPVPQALGGGKLDPETMKRFEEAAAQAAAADEAMLEALEVIAEQIGQKLSAMPQVTKGTAQKAIRDTIAATVGHEVPPITANSILRLIDTLTVGTSETAGVNWATWAFGAQMKIDSNSAKDVLLRYGQQLAKARVEVSSKDSDDEMKT